MKGKKAIPILLSFLIISVSGCMTLTKEGPLFSDRPRFNKIPVGAYEITVSDKREYIDSRKLIVPLMYVNTYMDRVSPKIDIDLIKVFKNILEQFIVKGDENLIFTVEILEVTQDYTGDKYSNTEYVSTKLNVLVKNKSTGEIIDSKEGEAWGSRKGFHATLNSIDKMLHDSIKLAFIDALNRLFD